MQVGEIQDDVMKKWQNEFRRCIAKNKHRRKPYYVLTKNQWIAGYTKFELKLVPFESCPPLLLNTMVHKVDNVKGSIEEITVVPYDDPDGVFDPSIPLGPVEESLIKLAPHLPLIHS